MSSSKLLYKLKTLAVVTCGASLFFAGYNISKGNEKFYNDFIQPVIMKFPPETSHRMAVMACKYNLMLPTGNTNPATLQTSFFGRELLNPIGIAAGFDKHGEAMGGLVKMGFGLIEIGSVTPLPQPGNPKPRVFRIPTHNAVINRYGFNSHGHAVVLKRVEDFQNRKTINILVGVNLGKNKLSEDAVEDYVKGVKMFGTIADYIVINISSPNTKNLRDLQKKDSLEVLLTSVLNTRNNLSQDKKVPLFLKLSPDLEKEEVDDIITTIKQEKCQVDGLIISNTTTDRSAIKDSEYSDEIGGLSGKPLKEKSTKLIAEIYDKTNGKIPIIGVGGISSGQDAYEKILAGASYVQLYTAMIYRGPKLVHHIKIELDELLKKDGYQTVAEAVGKGYKTFL